MKIKITQRTRPYIKTTEIVTLSFKGKTITFDVTKEVDDIWHNYDTDITPSETKDEELWETLTEDEQEEIIDFLSK